MKLSIIIPVYNGEKTLARAVESIFSQTVLPRDFEVLCINDGSGDRSGEVLAELAKKYPEQLKVRSRANRGVGATRQEGLEMARGEYITYLDCDDFLLPEYFTSLLPELDKGWDVILFDLLWCAKEKEVFSAAPVQGGEIRAESAFLSEPGPCNKIMRKSLFSDHALSFPEKIWYEDLATVPALFCHTNKIFYVKKPLYAYVQEGNSITRSESFVKKWEDIFPALSLLGERSRKTFPEETAYLAWKHLYKSFVWKYFDYQAFDEIKKIGAFMKQNFPGWQKNPLIREDKKAFFISLLFYYEKFGVLRLWKKQKKR